MAPRSEFASLLLGLPTTDKISDITDSESFAIEEGLGVSQGLLTEAELGPLLSRLLENGHAMLLACVFIGFVLWAEVLVENIRMPVVGIGIPGRACGYLIFHDRMVCALSLIDADNSTS